ncbi:MAG: hypothetical protein CVU01_02180 [Bacteroidetes bacterium HGW-Bacteroidetes-18]|nr:MAG: hypothetical protein CVU01_02180 [Bacteroidetes bacterium HGW-Bacteroidetes-18]
MNRKIVIYPRDIMLLTGKSESYARKEIQRLRVALKKEKHHKVTIKEYCLYYDFDYNDVLNALEKSAFKKVF